MEIINDTDWFPTVFDKGMIDKAKLFGIACRKDTEYDEDEEVVGTEYCCTWDDDSNFYEGTEAEIASFINGIFHAADAFTAVYGHNPIMVDMDNVNIGNERRLIALLDEQGIPYDDCANMLDCWKDIL